MPFTPGPFFVQVQDGFEVLVNDNASANRVELQVGDKVVAYIDKTTGVLHRARIPGGPNTVGLADSGDGAHVATQDD